MARVLEYQGKALLRGAGISTPRGKVCSDPADVDRAGREVASDVYVKTQVLAGDRASSGGIRLVTDPADLLRVAAELFVTPVSGLTPKLLLVEEAISGSWQGYLGISVAERPARREIRFSRSGGSGFNPANAEFVLDFEDALYPYRVRDALRRVGVPTSELVRIADFIARSVAVARDWCAYTLEINPAIMTADGVVAADCKLDIDDYSKALIPDASLLNVESTDDRERRAREVQATDHRGSFRYVQLIPDGSSPSGDLVASHSVGGGESMVVLDALAHVGLRPTNYCDTSGSPSEEKVAEAAALVAEQPYVSGLFFSTCIANQRLSVTARGLVAGWRRVGWHGPTVARFAGNEAAEARAIVEAWASAEGVKVVVLGEEADEWTAAEAMRNLITETSEGLSA